MDENLTQRQIKALETKAKIYESAAQLFGSQAYDEVKISDICEKAGVSVGIFYHYFPSKGHIFNEGYTNTEEILKKYLAQIKADPLKTIELMVSKYMEINSSRSSEFLRVFLRNQIDTKDPQSLRRKNVTLFKSCVSRAIEANLLTGDATEITNLIYRSLKGIMFEWTIDDSFSLEVEGVRLTNIILDHYHS